MRGASRVAVVRYAVDSAGQGDGVKAGGRETGIDLERFRLRRFVEELRQAGELEVRSESVDLAEIANKVVELFDAAAEDRQSHLRITGDRRVLVTGDVDLLFDALANLVDNAIKHGPEGGEVIVNVAHDRDGAVLSVADNGTGIPVAEHQHVFRRFYRLERSRSMPGNGLGLSLVAAVARLHGARIEMIDNHPGLRFRLLFPEPTTFRIESKDGPL